MHGYLYIIVLYLLIYFKSEELKLSVVTFHFLLMHFIAGYSEPEP